MRQLKISGFKIKFKKSTCDQTRAFPINSFFSSQLTAHSSQLTTHSSQAHNSQLTTHNPIFGILVPFSPNIYRQGQEHDAENSINFALTLKGIIGFSRIETTPENSINFALTLKGIIEFSGIETTQNIWI
ncbi:hypothetical protein ESY86_19350 [Subsaximicrobium wynnwilliamsii]|uniref:Uncharacterized protein n=1 Tax=Subsaximicrobium wynnwilliamsii TaxID=291179 RepID=A0A5C6ZDP6_9FLAO|nr:hypothetical protein [Subsaximicrobium wynnwilliamsii]TXD81090.1 hypothetical protein ESY87_19375 [Subsaximicrobium wynnwilliamsii]TXD86764.1 hypothetical protein ESY86_19350 [Subsaximicrobium wynnwilliamsii]TXE00393.1 hypothetical protein ESY88_19440 [Subsaximicrobium wynnwilliamsii]